MMIIAGIMALLALGAFVYLILYGIGSFLLMPVFGFFKKRKRFNSLPKDNDSEVELELSLKFKYYQSLNSDLKPFFVGRVVEFMNSKEFIGREGLVVSNEMKVLISAAAIQVTFGLDKFRFDTFGKIYIYPKRFYSRINKKYHVGEVNLAGAIVFSWEDFKKGFSNTNDNYNVALHEMAHALRFDKFKNDEFDEFFVDYFDKFLAVGRDEFFRVRNKENSFLREYAGVNKEEFFSVCVEHFFESPLEMKKLLPELFMHMCILLNQDPSALFFEKINVRENLLKEKTEDAGELFYSYSSSASLVVVPFFIILLNILYHCWQNFKEGFTSTQAIYLACFLVIYIAFGGFLISIKSFRFSVYKNKFVINYPLNPLLKGFILNFEKIISARFTHDEYYAKGGKRTVDILEITYTDGIVIKSKSFSINGISPQDVERIAACLRKKKAMIKIVGGKWQFKSIAELEKELPFNFSTH